MAKVTKYPSFSKENKQKVGIKNGCAVKDAPIRLINLLFKIRYLSCWKKQ